MINSVSSANVNNRVAFKSAIMSRVVQRNLDKNGDFFYSILPNQDNKIVGIYQSLAHKVGKAKKPQFINKLAKAIKDFDINDPFIRSTIIGSRSDIKRILLTGEDANEYRRLAQKHFHYQEIGKEEFISRINRLFSNNPSKKVYNKNGEEIGINLIVEDKKSKKRLIGIEITTLDKLNKTKPPEKNMLKNVKALKKAKTQAKRTEVKKSEVQKPESIKTETKNNQSGTQTTFDFYDKK